MLVMDSSHENLQPRGRSKCRGAVCEVVRDGWLPDAYLPDYYLHARHFVVKLGVYWIVELFSSGRVIAVSLCGMMLYRDGGWRTEVSMAPAKGFRHADRAERMRETQARGTTREQPACHGKHPGGAPFASSQNSRNLEEEEAGNRVEEQNLTDGGEGPRMSTSVMCGYTMVDATNLMNLLRYRVLELDNILGMNAAHDPVQAKTLCGPADAAVAEAPLEDNHIPADRPAEPTHKSSNCSEVHYDPSEPPYAAAISREKLNQFSENVRALMDIVLRLSNKKGERHADDTSAHTAQSLSLLSIHDRVKLHTSYPLGHNIILSKFDPAQFPDDAELRFFDHSDRLECCTALDFYPDLRHSIEMSWTRSVVRVFVESFLLRDSFNGESEDAAEASFRQLFCTLQRQYMCSLECRG
ncbi:hypothetical protein OBBRIDRAFT_808453 [Obba rivulosa]|uniref:Uncharacterized protein n=1 Tax=Obba rivulosa TaxID=1052685 RepID=A0A8E2ARZ5_9APHY|nr:hypothetical protein OBBRIDRAFT_808453 [Obba rivulosa]